MPIASEQMAVRLWRLAFGRIADAKTKLDGAYVHVVEERSSLRLDDRYLGTWRGGSLHVSAMQASVDALMTVQAILEDVLSGTGSLPMSGLYPIIRTSIECAALALYLLEPNDRDERLRRSYLIAVEDAKYQDSFTLGMKRESTLLRRRAQAEVRELIATRLSLGDPHAFRFDTVRYSSLVSNADAAIANDPAVPTAERMPLLAWWQLLSGLSHGKQWALITALERSGAIVDEANETAHVYQTSSTAAVALALDRGIETLETALRLFGRRSKSAWSEPEDGSEPAVQTWRAMHGSSEQS
jgi:hypothetical protein